MVKIPWSSSGGQRETGAFRMRTQSCAHLDKLMPVLYWFTRIGQHGRPVLPPGTVGVAAHAAHPDNLVMTDAESREERKEAETETEEVEKKKRKVSIISSESRRRVQRS